MVFYFLVSVRIVPWVTGYVTGRVLLKCLAGHFSLPTPKEKTSFNMDLKHKIAKAIDSLKPLLNSNIPSIHEACTGVISCAAPVVPFDLEERTATGHLESRTTYRSSHSMYNSTAPVGRREAIAEENRIVKGRVKKNNKTVRSGTCSTNVNDGSDTCTYFTNSADRRWRAEGENSYEAYSPTCPPDTESGDCPSEILSVGLCPEVSPSWVPFRVYLAMIM